jgi:hypothetical protein
VASKIPNGTHTIHFGKNSYYDLPSGSPLIKTPCVHIAANQNTLRAYVRAIKQRPELRGFPMNSIKTFHRNVFIGKFHVIRMPAHWLETFDPASAFATLRGQIEWLRHLRSPSTATSRGTERNERNNRLAAAMARYDRPAPRCHGE